MESSSWPENLPTDRKKAVEKLIRGREFANQLRDMLTKPFQEEADGSSVSDAGELIVKIMGSFTDTLSILTCTESDEVSQLPPNNNHPSWDALKSEDSSESCKTSATKDRRGCYKRRKTSKTWTKFSPTLIDDGHAWRKYGQKMILNAKHPRNYFRCTHRFDQGCQATKQVQITEDEPAMHRTTYHGDHTCHNLLKAPQIIFDSTTTARDSSILLNFESNNPFDYKPNDPFTPFLLASSIKQEQQLKEGGTPSILHNHHQQPSSSSEYFLSPELTAFEASGPPMTTLSAGSTDHGDVISSGVYSCTTSTPSTFEMDMMVGSVDFDDVLTNFEGY
ncbi:unnamed protein product [Ilex paraguariensis]|uniref:WRKY domain-containing protein n=1 Tax=Ilex paraguariensis TaxID=185542 RepID=A0ABC8RI41_9AQUA